MGFAFRDFQGIQFWVADDATDCTGAAGEKEVVPLPPQLGTISVLEFGFILQADTSDSSTMATQGEVVLDKVTISSGASTELDSVLLPYSTKKGTGVEGGSLNTVTASGSVGSSIYDTAPSFPEVDLSTHYLSVALDTQGVGGTQSVKPYVIYKVKPRTLNDI